jgi:predicted  nucleic acid-binding Zn-ribbon protein
MEQVDRPKSSLSVATDPADPTAGPSLSAAPANEDSAATGELYRLMSRRPSRSILTTAGALTALWVGSIIAYVGGFYGWDGLTLAPRAELALMAAAALAPLTLIWLVAFIAWRSQEMRLMADALARTALRLTEPEETAIGDVARLGNEVASHLDVVNKGVDDALTRAAALNIMLHEQLADIDAGSDRAEQRAAKLNEMLGEHKHALEGLAKALGNETDTATRHLSGQVASVRSVTASAEQKMEAASEKLRHQSEALFRASEAAIGGADATTSMLDRQSSRLEVVAQTALSKADGLTERYEAQRDAISEAALALESERNRLDASFEKHRNLIENTSGDLAARTVEIDEAVARLSRELTHSMETASIRAKELGSTFAGEVSTITRAANDAANTVGDASRSASDGLEAATATFGNAAKQTTEAAQAAAGSLERAASEIENAISTHSITAANKLDERIVGLRNEMEKTAGNAESASERLGAAMFGIGGAAKEAGRALHSASEDLEKRMTELPEEAADGAQALQRVLEDQVSALASIAEIVVRHARNLDRSGSQRTVVPPAAAAPAMPALDGTPHRDNSSWGISDLLAAAGHSEKAANKPGDGELHRRSLHIIESLQSIAIDLDRALEQSPPADLWRRYQAGERNVFARRLYNLQGRELYDQISQKYAAEREFRENADKFMGQFEQLLTEAADRDREGILADTYLTSDTGKVYLLLAQATGHLA